MRPTQREKTQQDEKRTGKTYVSCSLGSAFPLIKDDELTSQQEGGPALRSPPFSDTANHPLNALGASPS